VALIAIFRQAFAGNLSSLVAHFFFSSQLCDGGPRAITAFSVFSWRDEHHRLRHRRCRHFRRRVAPIFRRTDRPSD
jgi:hypothetical protein